MSRESNDHHVNGRLIDGFDYENQAWVRHGRYLNCGHSAHQPCGCYGREHQGEKTKEHFILLGGKA
jgi:hypothetical protein